MSLEYILLEINYESFSLNFYFPKNNLSLVRSDGKILYQKYINYIMLCFKI